MVNDQYKKMKNLFLRQSYIDAWEDYQRSMRKKSFAQWDYIVLTASNEEQANAFRSQITYRQNKNVLPCKTKYLVYQTRMEKSWIWRCYFAGTAKVGRAGRYCRRFPQ